MTGNVTIGLAWTTRYPHRFLSRLYNLDAAYRGPSLFAHRLLEDGSSLSFVCCDEKIEATWLDSVLIGQDVPVAFYLAGHGSFDGGGHKAILEHGNWALARNSIGCSLVVMETCSLVDTRKDWRAAWSAAVFGVDLRVILGFDGTATLTRGTALRGFAFAELLAQQVPIVEAWQRAVAQTGVSTHQDRPVAIVLGDDEHDARSFAGSATLSDIPRPRTTPTPYLHLVR